MFLRFNRRFKDGKEHRYWNIVESKRCAGGKVVQRQVLYLGEINDGQREAWCQLIEAFDERQPASSKKGTRSTLQTICERAPLIRFAFLGPHPAKIAGRAPQLIKLG
jgi:hypothetical protein